MNFERFIIIALLLIASPALAAGNLTVRGIDSAPSFVNTNQSYLMLNLSMNVTGSTGNGTVYISIINVTIGNSTPSVISAVEIKNSTGSVLGANATNSTATTFKIVIPNLFVVNSTHNTTISIFFNISASAPRLNLTSANISSSADIVLLNTTDSNVSIIGDSIQSTASQIQDVHAEASVTPKFVDTSVTEQIFWYTINVTGSDKVNRTDILIPAGYTLINWTNITTNTNTYSYGSANVPTSFNSTYMMINYTVKLVKGDNITIRFKVNTNSSAINSTTFDSKLTGSNLTNVPTYARGSLTNVTTKQLIIVQNVSAIKNAAIVNGSDYWEFNFTLNFTANVSGLLQFKMNNWSSVEGYMMNLSNQTGLVNATYYATFRESGNSSNYMNVTTNYTSTRSVDSTGVSLSVNTNNMYSIILKMIIPSGTPSSLTWYTIYWMLFRPTP